MKTNKILMAMVLAAGFTACTSEDVVESTQNALENRKVLGDIEFVMGGTESRFAQTEEGWVFETGDAFGAALVDVPNSNKKADAWKNYTLTNYIQTNYQYAKGEGNVWTTPARMVEGNYVFYAPFNEKHLTRKPMEVAFPITQTLDVEDGVVDPYSAINNAIKEGYPFFIDYKFLAAENQEKTLDLNFKHIYAYPEIKFVNESKDDVKLQKFVIYLPAGAEVYAKGSLNLAGKEEVASATVGGIVGNLFNLGTEKTATVTTGNDYGTWVKSTATNGKTGATADVITDEGAAKTRHIVVELSEGLTVEAGEEVKFNVVLPAKQYTGLQIFAMVNDEDGIASDPITVTFAPGKRYPASDYKSTGVLVSNPGDDFTVETGKDLEKAVGEIANAIPSVMITSSDELVQAISGTEGKLTVITTEGVVYGTEAVKAWDGSRCESLTVDGDLTIEGLTAAQVTTEVPALALGANITINGETTVKGIVSSAAVLNEVIVKKDAQFTTTKSIAGDVEIEEGGKLKADAKDITFANVLNNGTMEIAKAAAIGANYELTNKGTLDITAQLGGKVSNYGRKADNSGVEYAGTINVTGEYAPAATNLKGFWNVSGKLNMPAGATVDSVMTVSGGKIYNNFTVNGFGTLKVKEGAIIYNNVTMAGANEVLKTDGIAASTVGKTAKIEAGKAIFVGTVTGSAALNEIITATNETTFSNAPTQVEIQTTYTGTISKTADVTEAAKTMYAGADTYIYNGDVITTGETELGEAGKNVIIKGDVTTAAGALTITGSSVTFEKTVDLVSSNLTLTGATSVKFGGALTIADSRSITAASVTEATFSGKITNKNASNAIDLQNATVNMSGDLETGDLRAENVNVNGNVTVNGLLTVDNWMKIYRDKTLTVASVGKLAVIDPQANSATLPAFDGKGIHSMATNNDKASDVTLGTSKAGQVVVVAGGKVKSVTADVYSEENQDWWTGAASVASL